ncbi:conjugative transposon protein TraM [Sinomicrobium kalidii]|uniref:conjugative transposon protein TraM n=1 Tax=Sinomicrobium kalidii TaxID=2900738 RepID=UPI001E488BB1|nr:conjugative transposon protein TraM [Sinomicrobium kalidii]UGU15422.1 conjugative transposon protein TraM [Sinomicrobium kalidii]
MKIDKKKILFAAIIGAIVLLMIGYGVFVLGVDTKTDQALEQTTVPELGETEEQYEDRLEAVDQLKEKKKSDAPNIYDESLLDSTGLYDPDLEEKQKERMVDSIYNRGRIDYMARGYRKRKSTESKDTTATLKKRDMDALDKSQQDFFKVGKEFWEAATPKTYTQPVIHAVVHDAQTVKTNSRLELRLTGEAIINDRKIPKNTLVYGFVKLKENRVMINITNINHQPVHLKAYDLQDGNEGIYIENSIRAELTRQMTDDMIQDINIAGVPQVRGLKNVFRRDNRKVKNTIYNHYQLILKPVQQ